MQPVPARSRLAVVLYWGLPPLCCLALYWFGLRAWFQKDDFAWLSLQLYVHDFRSFVSALFTPLAQGTVRPLSERMFFLAGWWMFGLESPPFRAVAFATMFANLALLTTVTRRITGSAAAGLAAPLLWICNANLYIPMAWTSAYNQILCAFFLLLAFLFWLRFTESGHRRDLVGTWVAFVLGFGALEINVVFPAIAAAYALCFARNALRHTAPMFAVSALYATVHRAIAPPQVSDTYRMYFDLTMLGTLRKYVLWTFGADRYAEWRGLDTAPFLVASTAAGLALLAFSVLLIRRRQWLPVFCAAWFLITIAPVLPLRNHVSDYYLTVPVIGMAILGAAALARAFQGGSGARIASVVIVALYVAPSAWMAHGMTREYFRESRRVAHLVRSIAYAHRQHPGDLLLIRGVDAALFGNSDWDNSLRLAGAHRVYVEAPFDEKTPRRYVLSGTLAREAFRRGRLQVYDVVTGGRLRNVTPIAMAQIERAPARLPEYLDVRDELSAVHLGSGWWQPEPNHRWTSRRATLQLGAPARLGGELVLRGSYPVSGTVHLNLTVDGDTCPPSVIRGPAPEFQVRCRVAGQSGSALNVAIEVDRALLLPNDGRELGIAIATAEIAPLR